MIYIGKTDGSKLTKVQSGIGRSCMSRRFATEKEGMDFLDNYIAKIDPDGLKGGHYYIDGIDVSDAFKELENKP